MTKPSRILVVEDEPLLSRNLARHLGISEYDVVGVVPSGEEAVEKAEETRPDLVLMDISLEGEMNGIEAARRIRSRFDIAIVYLTAHSSEEFFDQAKMTEAFAYLVKPVSGTDLLHTVEMALYKHRTERELREAHADLETRVLERTAALARANEQLRAEIDQRKQAEAALQRSEERFRKIYEDAPVMMHSIDKERRIRNVNRKWLTTMGYEQDDVIGRKLDFLMTAESRKTLGRVLEHFWRDGEVRDISYQLIKKDSAAIDVIINSIVWHDPTLGTVSLTTVRDVTYEVQLRKQLIEAQKMEAVGTLAGGIAHDFNNMLTIALGNTELLLMRKEAGGPDYDELQAAIHACRRGADLVKRILTFCRRVETFPRSLNVNDEVKQAARLLSRTIPRMIEIKLILADDLKNVQADPTQIEQVLMNLAVNAQHAMPRGGKLTIETHMATLDEEYCRIHIDAEPGENVLLKVSDTGHGMEKEIVDHIFEPFFTTKKNAGGTGLGLAMVFGIVKGHKGSIVCESEPGGGTAFRIYLPVAEPETARGVAESEAVAAFGTESILLVDDEPLITKLGKTVLTNHGYTVLTAANGKEALEVYRKEKARISLVILDLIMPEMGGWECLEELLNIDPKAKVLIASGYSADAAAKSVVERGVKGFVWKPFDIKKLSQDVRRVLDEA